MLMGIPVGRELIGFRMSLDILKEMHVSRYRMKNILNFVVHLVTLCVVQLEDFFVRKNDQIDVSSFILPDEWVWLVITFKLDFMIWHLQQFFAISPLLVFILTIFNDSLLLKFFSVLFLIFHLSKKLIHYWILCLFIGLESIMVAL